MTGQIARIWDFVMFLARHCKYSFQKNHKIRRYAAKSPKIHHKIKRADRQASNAMNCAEPLYQPYRTKGPPIVGDHDGRRVPLSSHKLSNRAFGSLGIAAAFVLDVLV